MITMSDELPGGWVNTVVRVGATVRRPVPPRASFVHRLLDHLGGHDWPGAPRFLGTDEDGRQVLTYVEGQAAWHPTQQVRARTAPSLRRLARLVREFHDLTAGTELAEGREVVCHNDLAPRNTVYREVDGGFLPVAFLDWDIAAPGERVHDVAHLCWQYLDLGPGVTDVEEAGRLIRLVCDAYGLPDRTTLVATILWWQDRCRRGIEAGADAGQPAMLRLREAGVPGSIRAARDWVGRHRAALDAQLLDGPSDG